MHILKKLTLIIFVVIMNNINSQSIYKYEAKDINGKLISMSDFIGKKIMIVNTASKCGLTPQYKELEELYEKYKDNNFVIVGFPANNFMKQEPGDNKEIAQFCSVTYGITFPMMAKISVKGKDMHPIYNFLTTKDLNGFKDNSVKWNFQKYLINSKGELEEVISPQTSPFDAQIIKWINN